MVPGGRTGSFPGSAGMMKRQADGTRMGRPFQLQCVNGPEINSYVNNLMYKDCVGVEKSTWTWPVRLFASRTPYSWFKWSVICNDMCFSVNVNLVKEEIEDRYGVDFPDKSRYEPSYYYHAFSLPEIPAICSGNPGTARLLKWGLITGLG